MPTRNGYLLKKNAKRHRAFGKCQHFKCWLNAFQVTKTSYGFELTDFTKTSHVEQQEQEQPKQQDNIENIFQSFHNNTADLEKPSLNDTESLFKDYFY